MDTMLYRHVQIGTNFNTENRICNNVSSVNELRKVQKYYKFNLENVQSGKRKDIDIILCGSLTQQGITLYGNVDTSN